MNKQNEKKNYTSKAFTLPSDKKRDTTKKRYFKIRDEKLKYFGKKKGHRGKIVGKVCAKIYNFRGSNIPGNVTFEK